VARGTALTAISGFVDRRTFLPARARGLRVVHLGCVDEGLTLGRLGTGQLLHEELSKTASSLLGVDISREGLAQLSREVPGEYLEGDVLELTRLPLPQSCDLVIAAELIEHLRAPSVFLEELRAYLSLSGARAVLTTPNAYSWLHWLRLAVTRREHVHPDHLLAYTPATLIRAVRGAGLQVDALWMHRWSRRGLRRWTLGLLDALLLRWNPHLALGFVVEVSPCSMQTEALGG
jgi:SAM-dependent methyltransferase